MTRLAPLLALVVLACATSRSTEDFATDLLRIENAKPEDAGIPVRIYNGSRYDVVVYMIVAGRTDRLRDCPAVTHCLANMGILMTELARARGAVQAGYREIGKSGRQLVILRPVPTPDQEREYLYLEIATSYQWSQFYIRTDLGPRKGDDS